MSKRKYPPFSRKARQSKWQPDHVFVIAGPGAFDYARSLYRRNRYQPTIPCPENISPELYKWPVNGMDVTIKNLGTSIDFAEELVYELLRAGAKLVVHIDTESSHISVHRDEEVTDAA